MKRRGLVVSVVALILGLSAVPAFAQPAKKEPAVHKSARIPVASCDLYSKWVYITGSFSGYSNSDHFTRDGMGIGAGCYYQNHSRLSLGIGAEVYAGDFDIEHEEYVLKGSFSYLELGFKEWVRTALDLHHVSIGLEAGVEKTGSKGLGVNDLHANFGGGWLDLTEFAADHLISRGSLEVWEAGVDVGFPFNRDFSLTFGLLWQRYNVSAHIDFDMEGRDTLIALHQNPDGIKKDYSQSVDFFYLTPGAKWCVRRVWAALVIPWVVVTEQAWVGGTVLQVEWKF